MTGTRAPGALLGLLVAVACACGSASTPAGSATITVTQADAAKTIQARVGDTVRVVLEEQFPVPGSSLVWRVSSSDTAILAPGQTTGSPSPGPAIKKFTYQADFRASAAGRAQLQAHGATSCEAMAKQSCPDQDFTVTVIVGG